MSSLANLVHARILLEGQGDLGHRGVGVGEACHGSADDENFPGSGVRLDPKRR